MKKYTKEYLLETICSKLHQIQLNETNMRQFAELCDCSTLPFYHLFGSKKQFIDAVVRKVCEESKQEIQVEKRLGFTYFYQQVRNYYKQTEQQLNFEQNKDLLLAVIRYQLTLFGVAAEKKELLAIQILGSLLLPETFIKWSDSQQVIQNQFSA